MPRHPSIPEALLWSICATGALVLTGQLAVCDSPDDLDHAFVAFLGLLRVGEVDLENCFDASLQVLGEFMDAGQQLESRLLADVRSDLQRVGRDPDEARAGLRVAEPENLGAWKLIQRFHAQWDADVATIDRRMADAESDRRDVDALDDAA